jgi:prepilin-type N-terminal cleavage/methylation domain-containing protein
MKSQKGFGLIEVLVSMAIIVTAGVAFLGGLTISTKILTQTDTSETSRDLAIAQIEYIKSMPYSTNDWEYTLSSTERVSTEQPIWWLSSPPSLLDAEKYGGYSITATAKKLDGNNDENIKSITIEVYKNKSADSKPKQTLVSYLFNSSGQ